MSRLEENPPLPYHTPALRRPCVVDSRSRGLASAGIVSGYTLLKSSRFGMFNLSDNDDIQVCFVIDGIIFYELNHVFN